MNNQTIQRKSRTFFWCIIMMSSFFFKNTIMLMLELISKGERRMPIFRYNKSLIQTKVSALSFKYLFYSLCYFFLFGRFSSFLFKSFLFRFFPIFLVFHTIYQHLIYSQCLFFFFMKRKHILKISKS